MPTLEEALKTDRSNYTPVVAQPSVNPPTPSSDLQPGRSSMMRCPLPILGAATPDALRSYFIKGQVPQTRLLTPQSTVRSTDSSSSTSSSSFSSSSTSVVTATLSSAQATLTTAVLSPGAKFSGHINLSKSFQLLSIAISSAARVELYGTANAQSLDLARGLDIPPAAGTAQNIICDVILDTAPYQWSFQNRVGANADTPQSSSVYVTVTNLGTTSAAITVTLAYVPMEA